MEVKYNKDGTPAKKRGRPPGSKNKPRTATQILTATKGNPKSTAKPKRVARQARTVAREVAPVAAPIEKLPLDQDVKFWRDRYAILEAEVRRLLEFIGHEAVRDNIEPEYNLRIWLNSKYKDVKFAHESKPKRGIMADPFTRIYHFLDNEDVYQRNSI